MAINRINSQFPDNVCLKIYNMGNVKSFVVECGKFYACFSSIHNLGKQIFSKDKRYIFPLGLFYKRKIDPFIERVKVESYEDIFFDNFQVFRHIRLCKLLGNFGFSDNEMNCLFKEFNIKRDIYADDIIHVRIKAAILIDILFQKSDVVLFHTSGLSYSSNKTVYQRIYKRLKEHPNKAAIIFEYGDNFEQIIIEEVSLNNINDYERWRNFILA